MHYSEYPANSVYTGIYYKVTRKGFPGGGHTFIPGDSFELPVNEGDEFTKYNAPYGFDAALSIADFSALVGPAWPEVTRVKVCGGVLINEQASDSGSGSWRPVASLKHALKLQEKFNTARAACKARRAVYEADTACEVRWTKYDGISIEDFIKLHGIKAGWFVRTTGFSVWTEISNVYGSSLSVHSLRNHKERGRSYRSDSVSGTYEAVLTFRPTRPLFAESASDGVWASHGGVLNSYIRER